MIGEVAYAVRIQSVREIVNPLSVVPLPRAPEDVRGVASFRGEIVAVVDMRARFKLPAVAPSRKTKWLVIDVNSSPYAHEPRGTFGDSALTLRRDRSVALVVDSMTDVFGTAGRDLLPAPPLGDAIADEQARSIEGVARYGKDGSLVFVLDVRAFQSIADSVAPGNEGPVPLRMER